MFSTVSNFKSLCTGHWAIIAVNLLYYACFNVSQASNTSCSDASVLIEAGDFFLRIYGMPVVIGQTCVIFTRVMAVSSGPWEFISLISITCTVLSACILECNSQKVSCWTVLFSNVFCQMWWKPQWTMFFSLWIKYRQYFVYNSCG